MLSESPQYVSEIESDQVGDFSRCRAALSDLGLGDDLTDEDCSAMRHICECVSRRAAFMAAAGITALLKKMDYKVKTIHIPRKVSTSFTQACTIHIKITARKVSVLKKS